VPAVAAAAVVAAVVVAAAVAVVAVGAAAAAAEVVAALAPAWARAAGWPPRRSRGDYRCRHRSREVTGKSNMQQRR
jgi:hypothetical protein